MVQRILSSPQEELLAEDRRLLGALQAALARFDAAAEDQQTLAASVTRLDELFLAVVAGEFNAGKSAFINALLGRHVLEEGVTPTTTHVYVLRYGDVVERSIGPGGVEMVTAPLELLREVNLVDTPGTNAVLRRHEAITKEFVPNSDLVLFVTSADRPFTESERAFLEQIREWGKKVVIVINKIDAVASAEDVERIESFVAENAARLLGITPAIFPVSARLALEAKQLAYRAGSDAVSAEAAELLKRSRFAALERYVVDTLDESERVRLKLANPLGVGLRLAGRYLEVAEGRITLLKDDFDAIEDIERQLDVYRDDMGREFRFRLSDVEKVLTEFESRGIAFFDETMRLGRVFDLINKAKIRSEFEREVVADVPRKIETRVTEVIDWMVASELRQWQAVTEHLAERRHRWADRIVGGGGGNFDYDRSRLLEKVGGAARRTVDSYDGRAESARLAESVQTAVAGAALLEVGAVGLGTVITLAATSTAADVTGILAAGTVAAIGLFIIPARRRQAKVELREKIADLKTRLMRALTDQFDDEVTTSVRRIQEAIAPYTRFVRAERQRLTTSRDELADLRSALDTLRQRIERLA